MYKIIDQFLKYEKKYIFEFILKKKVSKLYQNPKKEVDVEPNLKELLSWFVRPKTIVKNIKLAV